MHWGAIRNTRNTSKTLCLRITSKAKSKVRYFGTYLKARRPRSLLTYEEKSESVIVVKVDLWLIFSSDAKRRSFASQVNTATSEYPSLPASTLRGEDPDGWLNVDANDFEAMLERTIGAKAKEGPNDMDVDNPEAEDSEERLTSEQATRLKDLAAKVEDFVEGEGDLEGAKFDE